MLDQHTINLLERLVIAVENQNQTLKEINKTLDSMDLELLRIRDSI